MDACHGTWLISKALPPELFSIWQAYPWIFGKPFCIFKTFLSETTYAASILTITAFTVERYIAICHPIKAQMISNLSRAVKVILLVWVIACCSASPYMHYVDLFYAAYRNVTPIEASLTCNIPQEKFADAVPLFQISAFLFFVTPMCIISVLYILIGITLKRSGLSRRASDDRATSTQMQSRRAVLKMLVAVVVAFFICWAPFHIQRLLTIYLPAEVYTDTFNAVYTQIFYVSGTLYFVSSTVNPILYNLMSRKYREAFKMTLCRCCYSKEVLRRGGRGKYMIGRTSSLHSSCNYTQTTRIPGSIRSHPGALQKNNNHDTSSTRASEKRASDPQRKNLIPHGMSEEKTYSSVNNGSTTSGACPDIKITDPRGCDVTPRDRVRKDSASKRGDSSKSVHGVTVYFPRHQIITGNTKKPGSFV
ncbi:pyrokinin-1 receptor-like isoform X2 [Lineus longissimus]|uniref:pyrokinin-1 receptor-like isoform X2 n=1 Tax=Lineus longissimus TaxID=88925 RepID=UPI00315CBB8A